MARHSRLNSSITVSIRYASSSCVRSATESYAHTWFGYAGRSRTQEPSLSHSRPRFGCRDGTFNPSLRQILSTRFLLTFHPASSSIRSEKHQHTSDRSEGGRSPVPGPTLQGRSGGESSGGVVSVTVFDNRSRLRKQRGRGLRPRPTRGTPPPKGKGSSYGGGQCVFS